MDAPLHSVSNAARLLKAFLSREDTLGVSELARRLGLGKSAVHRLLVTLAAEGLVTRAGDGRYRLGLVVFELGEAVRSHMDLHAAAGPVLVELREQTGESSQVGILDGDEVVYVDRCESTHSLRLFHETGRRVPLHCTSSGKVLLAAQPTEHRERVLAGGLAAHTPHTIVAPAALRAELDGVRARGWADAVNERELGVASLAAPVRGPDGSVVAAISVGAPVMRYQAVPHDHLVRCVTEAAEAVSRRLGWAPAGERRPSGPRPRPHAQEAMHARV